MERLRGERLTPHASTNPEREAGRRRIFSTSEGTNAHAFTAGDWLRFAVVASVFGSSFLLMATGLDAFEPGLVTWLRCVAGTAFLWLLPAARRPVAAADWPRVIALSVIWIAIPFTLFPLAQQHINSATAGMINGALPIAVAVVASVMLRRLPRAIHVVGLGLGFGGVVAISVPSLGSGSDQTFAVLLVVGAVALYGVAVNIAAPVQQRYGSVPLMARMLLLASAWTAPFGLVSLDGSHFAWPSFIAILVLGAIGTGMAFALMASLVGSVGSTRGAAVTYIVPVVALGLGVVVRGELVDPLSIIGVAGVVSGAALVSRPERPQANVGARAAASETAA